MTTPSGFTKAPSGQLEPSAWSLGAGSVIGADHRRSGRPNQDSWAVHRGEGCVVGVVADGCGSGRHSEVGAWIGSRLWVRAVGSELEAGLAPGDEALWRGACERSLRALAALLGELTGEPWSQVSEALLFTLVGFVLTPTQLVIHAIGDGVVWVDGRLTRLGPFPGNRPPYLAYGLGGSGACPEVQIVERLDPAEIDRVIIGTDGAVELIECEDRPLPGGDARVGPLAQFGAPRYLSQPDALRRRLSVINREQLSIDWSRELVDRSRGLLTDDTTLLVLGRQPTRSSC